LFVFFTFFEQERKAEAALLSLGVGRIAGGSPTSGPGSPLVTMGTPTLPLHGGSLTSGGTKEGTSEAMVVAIKGFAGGLYNMEESPPGAEGDEELPLRAEGLGLVSLSSVDGSAGSSLEGKDGVTS
jgi:hypothetical protein